MVRSVSPDSSWLDLCSRALSILQRTAFADTPTGIRVSITRSEYGVVMLLEVDDDESMERLYPTAKAMGDLLAQLGTKTRKTKATKRTRASKSADAPKAAPEEPSSTSGDV